MSSLKRRSKHLSQRRSWQRAMRVLVVVAVSLSLVTGSQQVSYAYTIYCHNFAAAYGWVGTRSMELNSNNSEAIGRTWGHGAFNSCTTATSGVTVEASVWHYREIPTYPYFEWCSVGNSSSSTGYVSRYSYCTGGMNTNRWADYAHRIWVSGTPYDSDIVRISAQ